MGGRVGGREVGRGGGPPTDTGSGWPSTRAIKHLVLVSGAQGHPRDGAEVAVQPGHLLPRGRAQDAHVAAKGQHEKLPITGLAQRVASHHHGVMAAH